MLLLWPSAQIPGPPCNQHNNLNMPQQLADWFCLHARCEGDPQCEGQRPHSSMHPSGKHAAYAAASLHKLEPKHCQLM